MVDFDLKEHDEHGNSKSRNISSIFRLLEGSVLVEKSRGKAGFEARKLPSRSLEQSLESCGELLTRSADELHWKTMESREVMDVETHHERP